MSKLLKRLGCREPHEIDASKLENYADCSAAIKLIEAEIHKLNAKEDRLILIRGAILYREVELDKQAEARKE